MAAIAPHQATPCTSTAASRPGVLQGTLSSRIDLLGGKGGFLPGLMTDVVATKQHVAGFGPAQAAAVTFIIQASRQGEPVGLRATLTPGEMDEILNDFAAGLQTVPGCLPDLAAYLTPVPRVNWSKMLLFTYVRQIVAAHNADLLNPVQCFPVPAALQGATPRARWVNYLLTCAKEAAGLLPAGPNGQMPIPVINPTVTSASTTAILAVLLRATAAELTNPHYTVVGALSPKEMIEGINLVLSTLTAPQGIFDILERVIALLRFHMDWFHEDKSGEESQLMMAEKAFSQLIRLGKTPSLHPFSFLAVLKKVPSLQAAHKKVLEALELAKDEGKSNKQFKRMVSGVDDTKTSEMDFEAEDLIDTNGKMNIEAMREMMQQQMAQAFKRQKVAAAPAGKEPANRSSMTLLLSQVMAKFHVQRKEALAAAIKLTSNLCAHCKGQRVAHKCTACNGQGAPHKDFVKAVDDAVSIAAW
jgi:hypothetical protein